MVSELSNWGVLLSICSEDVLEMENKWNVESTLSSTSYCFTCFPNSFGSSYPACVSSKLRKAKEVLRGGGWHAFLTVGQSADKRMRRVHAWSYYGFNSFWGPLASQAAGYKSTIYALCILFEIFPWSCRRILPISSGWARYVEFCHTLAAWLTAIYCTTVNSTDDSRLIPTSS